MDNKTAKFLIQFNETTQKEILKFGTQCCLNLMAYLKECGYDFHGQNTDEVVANIVLKTIKGQ